MADVITGLSCPNCAGRLEVREGQRIVRCPYCEARSFVRGEKGVSRYQVARRVDREAAAQAVRGFWSGLNKAMDLPSRARLTELFLVYLPYWRALAQVAGWIFGQKRISSGKSTHYEPREHQIMQPMEWTGAAGDVAEFGVERVSLAGAQLAAYDAEALHAEGMVFEPTGSLTDAREAAHAGWEAQARERSGLSRIAQTWLRFLREALAIVYYPLWVARYAYRQRSYQVVVDGKSGRVLYGKAPGNVLYRALMLVAGTALGSFLIVDGTAVALAIIANSSDDDSAALLVVPIAAGAALIAGGYRLFRWGEEIEQRAKVKS
jgi:DNA-directed RNA polymerase subunit RPC12/RpoP